MDHFTTVRDKFINDVSREERQVLSHSSFFLFEQRWENLHIGANIIQCVSKAITIIREK